MKYLKRLYDWVLSMAESKFGLWALFFISFIESSFFPIPPDLLLIPLVLAKPKKGLWYAFICTTASVLGGIFGYIIGYYFMDMFGYPIIKFYNAMGLFSQVKAMFNEYGLWAVGIAGVTPIPYKIFTIASGVFSYSIVNFIIISFISRGIRFFSLAFLISIFGERIKIFIEKYFNLLTIAFMILLILGYALLSIFY